MGEFVQNEKKERIFWIDNIRWITILLVVVYHVFFYYNNIAMQPMYKHKNMPLVSAQSVTDITNDINEIKVPITFAGVFQYSIYPWFMLLLFIISGMCAKMYLDNKTTKTFLKSRIDKLLVTSTIGVICFHWITGLLVCKNYPAFVDPNTGKDIQIFVKYIIYNIIGTGHLWFCQVLFVGCLILALLRVIDKTDALFRLTKKSDSLSIFFVILMCPILYVFAQLDCIPITTYRFFYYITSFLFGYYIFSCDSFLNMLSKIWWIFVAFSFGFGFIYFKKIYGKTYTDLIVINDFYTIAYGFSMSLAILGLSKILLNLKNRFTTYCSKISFGVYVLHIFLLITLNNLLIPFADNLSIWIIYLLEFVVSLGGSIILWELLSKIPVVRYILFGIRKNHKLIKKVDD